MLSQRACGALAVDGAAQPDFAPCKQSGIAIQSSSAGGCHCHARVARLLTLPYTWKYQSDACLLQQNLRTSNGSVDGAVDFATVQAMPTICRSSVGSKDIELEQAVVDAPHSSLHASL
jgi:hypothetical protein